MKHTTKQIAENSFIRNGGNRYFKIISYTSETVVLQEYNPAGAMDSIRRMDRFSFDGLVRMKNYEPVNFFQSLKTGRWMERRDLSATRQLGLERLLVQQTYSL